MARIPTYISEERANTALPEGAGRISVTPEQMGAGVGAAQQQLGQTLVAGGVAIGNLGQDLQKKQEKLETANAIGKYSFADEFSKLQSTAAVDAKDFPLNVANAYDAHLDRYVN